MGDVTEFLLARLDEIEREAKSQPLDYLYIDSVAGPVEMFDLGPGYALVTDPARVLADAQAKRAIAEWAQTCEEQDVHVDAWTLSKIVIRQLATAYADHPDYREEWKP